MWSRCNQTEAGVAVEVWPEKKRFQELFPLDILILSSIAIAIRLFFWFYTGRTWEDALITVQHAENAARGLGLTHAPGRTPIHGFTSPISVLIPLIGEFLHRGFGLPLQKLVSAVCGGISVWLGMRIAQRLSLARPITLIVGGYLAIEHHQILFGMAGMETQVAVTILLFSFYSLFDSKPLQVGLALGLCMLARPDFLFWVAVASGLIAYRSLRDRTIRPLAIVLITLIAVYGPWLIFTTCYYGSPIPNTILAKGFAYPSKWYAGLSSSQFLFTIKSRARDQIFGALGAAYAGNGTGFSFFGDHGLIAFLVLVFFASGLIAALRRLNPAMIGIFAFVIVYASYYMFLTRYVFTWYTVPLAAATILGSAIGLNSILAGSVLCRIRMPLAYALALLYLGSFIAVTPLTFRGERNVQRYVENSNRKQIGLYLANVSTPQQTIGLEPLGYVGYYSRRRIYDYPGLCNREVVRYIREHPGKRNLVDMLAFFRPDFIVLRPYEYKSALAKGHEWLKTDYTLIREFRVPPERVRQLLFPNRNIDLQFEVLKRNDIVR